MPDDWVHIFGLVRRILLLAITVYVAITGILYLFQNNMIFHKPGIEDERLQLIQNQFPEAEEVTIKAPDNTGLHGWLVRNAQEEPSPLLIYFGGNAEEVSWMIEEKDNLKEWSLLLVNYRGYGLSKGKPGEDTILADALLLYDHFSGREDIKSDNVAVMGRSLGTAAAVYLTAKRPVLAAVLVSPFISMENIAKDHFPFIPVRLLLKHKFKVKSYANEAETPMLTLIAKEDNIIPAYHSQKLYTEWKGEKNLTVIQNAGHNNISMSAMYWKSIRNFLNNQIKQ